MFTAIYVVACTCTYAGIMVWMYDSYKKFEKRRSVLTQYKNRRANNA